MANELARDTLAQQAYATVRERILKGELTFGEPVSRRKLAGELGISLPPVAEALQKLEHEGLVESRPRVGTRVRLPTEDDVRGHCLVREALECQAARIFAEVAGERQRKRLQQMGGQVDSMLRSSRVNRVRSLRLHERFHNHIPQAVQYPAFADALQKAKLAVWTWMSSSLYWSGIGSNKSVSWKIAWHSTLAEALNSGDPLKAETEMRAHVRSGMELMLQHLRHYLSNSRRDGFRSGR